VEARRRGRRARWVGLVALAWSLAAAQQESGFHVRKARAIEMDGFVTRRPAGVVFSPVRSSLLILQSGVSERLEAIDRFGRPLGGVSLGATVADPVNGAWSDGIGGIVFLSAGRDALLAARIQPGAASRVSPVTPAGLPASLSRGAAGIAVDPARGTIFLLDAFARQVIRIDPDPLAGQDAEAAIRRGAVTPIALVDLQQATLRGIAFHPGDGHLFVLDPADRLLHELTVEGRLVSSRDLAAIGLRDPGAMVFAPSGDQTDDPALLSLYVADAGTAEAKDGFVVELSLVEPAPVLAATAASSLVRTIDTSRFAKPSPDPSGLAYHPGRNHLLISDGEVEEMSIWAGANVWETTLAGSVIESSSTLRFSDEPTGVAYNPANDHWFFSDDTGDRYFYEVALGADGRVGTADDTVTTIVTADFGSGDPEGIAYDTRRGYLYIADGVNAEIYEVRPGANGRFDGVAPAGDDQVSHFDTASKGLSDPEGVEYNADSDTLYIVGNGARIVAETTVTGTLVRTLDVGFLSANALAGVAYAPASDGSAVKHLYLADRAVDNNSNPNENDGKIYEVTLGTSTCGNGVREPGEACDGSDIGGATCSSQGCSGGTPTCTPTCTLSYASCTGCTLCGNNVRDAGEVCDGSDLGGQTCQTQGFSGGTLACLANCTGFNTAGCTTINPGIVEVRVATSTDDAEQAATGAVDLNSSDLELVFDGSNQTVGLRFAGVPIARGAQITNAYVQFKVDEAQSETTLLTIQGQAADNAATFTSTSSSISSRPRTTASVAWPQPPATTVPAWTAVGAVGADQRTPNLAPIIREIVDRSGWNSGNALVLIIDGTGHRTAEAYDGDAAGAPLLHVELSAATCGNGVIEAGEQCDGSALGGATCSSQGCSGGTPTCTASCTLSYSSCTGCQTCGNGIIEGSEQCDGSALGGATCAAQNCAAGTPTCTATCTLSYSTCSICCGNGIIEGSEQCDGSALGGATCASQSCTGGTPSCTASCTVSYSTCTGCPVCGNNVKEGAEVCDGTDLAGQTCLTRGFGSGTLRCLTNCSGYDTSLCSVCDLDGICEASENCTNCPTECIQSAPRCGNHICETGNGEDCRSCPQDCNGAQGGKPAKRYCCGDGDGTNPVGCGDSRCTASGNTCQTAATPTFCCGNGSCQSGETGANCAIDCAP